MRKSAFAVLLFWLICFSVNVAFWGGLVWAAVHFIRKFW